MKCKICLFLTTILMLSLAGCGGDPAPTITELSLNTMYSVEEYADITLKKVYTSDVIEAPMGNSNYYDIGSDTETYVDVVFDVTNQSTNKINSDDLMVFSAKNAEDAIYSGDLYLIEKDNSTYLSGWEDINPKATVRFHAAVAVAKDETNLDLNFVINGEQFTLPYTVGDTIRDVNELSVDSKIEASDYASLTFKGIEYTDDLLPSDTSGWYNHYQIDNNSNTYLVVKYDVMNLQSGAKEAEDFVGVSAVYMDKYKYDGFVVVEETDFTGFDSGYEEIDPLTERHCYYLIEIPKSVTENPVEVTVYFDGQEYVYSE